MTQTLDNSSQNKLVKFKVPPRIIHQHDVEFGRGGDRFLKMDILKPQRPTSAPLPALVWIHGGAWRKGSKTDGTRRLLPFARSGYLCASIEYRLSHEAIFPAQIEDCKCAIRFLRAHAKDLGLNANKIGVWGSSAGGHLAALLGTSHHVKALEGTGGWQAFSSDVQAVCDWFGPTDFLKMGDFPSDIDHNAWDSPEALLIGGLVQENLEKVANANPITYITQETPPFLIMHADDDDMVPFNQSELLFDALKQVSVEVTLEVVKGGGHGTKFNSPQVLQKVKQFFQKYLKCD
jgi:acetyl esterase/lipase